MYIIDETYFTRKYAIPNTNEAQTEAKDNLELFINQCVRQLLRDALGVDLFNELDGFIVEGVFDEDTAPDKWKDFVLGKEYTLNDVKLKWPGIISEEGLFKQSLLVPYVFHFWLENEFSIQSGVGEVVVNAKNAKNVNPTQSLVSSWNDFILFYQGSTFCNHHHHHIYYNFEGVRYVDYYPYHFESINVSLIKFLKDHPETYPNTNMRTYDPKNQLGI